VVNLEKTSRTDYLGWFTDYLIDSVITVCLYFKLLASAIFEHAIFFEFKAADIKLQNLIIPSPISVPYILNRTCMTILLFSTMNNKPKWFKNKRKYYILLTIPIAAACINKILKTN